MKSLRLLFQDRSPRAARFRLGLQIALLLLLFGILFWVIPFTQVLEALKHVDLSLFLLGLTVGFLSLFLDGLQVYGLARRQGIQRNPLQIFAINLAVRFYSLFAPGTLVPAGIKWYRLAQPGGKTAEALATLGFYRMMETFLNLLVGTIFWLLSSRTLDIKLNWFTVAAAILVMLVGWNFVIRFSLPLFRWLQRRLANRMERPTWSMIFRRLEKLMVAVDAFRNMPAWEQALVVLTGVTALLVGVISKWWIARSLAVPLSFLDIGWINSLVTFATQLPFAVAGGVGLREITLVTILPLLGVGPEVALAFSLLLTGRSALHSLVGGLVEAGRIIFFHPRSQKTAIEAPEKEA